ncbi:hypothetical protein E8E12_009641 [Didymella heteroderae]|uniref:Uncharacterized protein n=1 Tax=Didymella heteroderae TaxID=1769908 RepID=A0A9P5C5E3_9PLEO|nr:hypothetical protein E8E12_009641 [Didymella heteroderae]
MDIRKWLAETENPASSEQPELDRFLLPPSQHHTVPDARRRRKRSSSDSSLLEAASPQLWRKGTTAKKLERCEVPSVVNEGHSDISHSASGRPTGSSAASQRYARKPRHKTRADKYDIVSGKAKDQYEGQRPSRKSESRKSKRRSRRKKNESTHNGIGQDFQAGNVSKDRLTLKPSEKIGLFSKGRTSTSIKGRGLPDLVFSEMRFLRNNHGRNDHITQAPDAKKRQKKDHARTKEEDISAFFTTARPALAETDGNVQAKSECPTGASAAPKADRPRLMADPSRASEIAVPTVESESKASYLGFTGQGPRHESTSCFSWLESICAPTVTPGQPMDTLANQNKRVDAWIRETDAIPHGRGTSGHHEIPTAEAPTFRFAALDTRLSRLPNSSGPGFYVQQEQRQRLPMNLGSGNNSGCRYSNDYGQEYMSETGVLDHKVFEDLSDEQGPYGVMEDIDDDVEGLDYVADGVEQAQKPERMSVVTPGFWRPNRLY